MPGKGLIDAPSDLVYIYDGSMAGFYCCVFESVYSKELPADIQKEGEAQPTLFQIKKIETDAQKAKRVENSVSLKISPRAKELLQTVFLSCLPQKEIAMLRFLLLGYKQGKSVCYMLGHQDVAPMLAAEKHLNGEAHLLKGFIRFSDYDGVLAAAISPKNFVLPFLSGHFIGRFSQENFMIYDKTHKAAFFYEDRKQRIIPLEHIEFPTAGEEEENYRSLWKQFYRTVSIEARENPVCRRSHMPKRYWANMTEMAEYL